jgi:hypothetical protein
VKQRCADCAPPKLKQKYRTYDVGGLLDCCRQPAVVHGVEKRSLWVALPPISPPQIRPPTAAAPSEHLLSHLSQRRGLLLWTQTPSFLTNQLVRNLTMAFEIVLGDHNVIWNSWNLARSGVGSFCVLIILNFCST